MEAPRIPVIPIPPSTEVKVSPRPLMAELIGRFMGSDGDDKPKGLRMERVDRVEFSIQGRSYTSARQLVKEVLAQLSRLARDAAGSQRLHGQEEFEDRFESHDDFSPRGTANLILSGVTGYIYGAFRMSRPEMSEADLDHFHQEAARGIRRGFREAEAYLTGLELFQDDVEENAKSTVERVLNGLDSFVAAERERLFGSQPADPEDAE